MIKYLINTKLFFQSLAYLINNFLICKEMFLI